MVKSRIVWSTPAALLLLSLARPAVAQVGAVDANEIGATSGVLLPSPSITETADATALAVNPASLAFLGAWNLAYVGSWLQYQQRIAGQGHGFFFGVPVGPLAFGVGVEPLLPPDDIIAWQGLGHRTRFSIGLALNLKRIIGIGLAYRTFWFERYGDIQTMDIGLTIHPMNALAFSFVFSDVNAPRFRYKPWPEDVADIPVWTEAGPLHHRAPRQFNVGLTIRPLSNDRLSIGGELKYLYGDMDDVMSVNNETGTFSRTDLMAIITGMPLKGISLKLRFTAEGIRGGYRTNLILDGAIAFQLPNFGVGASMNGQLSPSGAKGYMGTSWFATVQGDVAPAISLPRPLRAMHVVVFDIEQKLDSYGLASAAELFDRIERDRGVDMVLIRPDQGTVSLADAGELRHRIKRLRNSGRKVACYLTEATAGVYFACAGADYVWLNPAGGVRIAGLKMELLYFRDLFDKLGVKADIQRIAEYKSAPESYTRNGPSDWSKEQTNVYLDSVYDYMVSAIDADRGLGGLTKAKKTVENGPFTAVEAKSAKLVDATVTADVLESKITDIAGGQVFFDEDYYKEREQRRHYLDAPAVAVVHIDGDIVDGESLEIPFLNMKMTGAKTMTKLLREIAGDARIHAVVLRIDSPGGSAMASDLIWREVMALRAVKPVIASLGSVAASGAYYIASAADEIFADATTITGSIGIYYGKADLSGLLDKVGIDVATFKRGEHADQESWSRPYTVDERKKMIRQLMQFYKLFLERIVEGRGRGFTVDIADKLGRGRIWSGAHARYHLLIDTVGGYSRAVDRARLLADIPRDIPVYHFPKPSKNIVVRMLSSAMTTVRSPEPSAMQTLLTATGIKRLLTPVMPFAVQDPAAPRARLPFIVVDE